MSEIATIASGRMPGPMNGVLNEGAAMLAVGDHQARLAGWTARLRGLRVGDAGHREQLAALRVAVRISRSEFGEIERALTLSSAQSLRVREVSEGYGVLAETLSRRAA